MRYEEFYIDNKEEALNLLSSNNREEIVKGIIGSVNGINDFDWLQEMCLKFCLDKDFWVAKTAISSLSDISRIYRKLNREKVNKVLSLIVDDALKNVIEETNEDINIFLRKTEL